MNINSSFPSTTYESILTQMDVFLVLFTIFAFYHDNFLNKGALAIRRIFSLVDTITKPKFSNGPNIFKIGLFL